MATGFQSGSFQQNAFQIDAGGGGVAYSLSGDPGIYTLTGQDATFTYSGKQADNKHEVEIGGKPRRVYLRRGSRVLVFDSVADADAYEDAEREAQRAIEAAQKTSKSAKKRVIAKVLRARDIAPAQTVDLEKLGQTLAALQFNADLKAMIRAQDWAAVDEIYLRAMEQEDEDEIEMLLLGAV